ncbi:MAG: hypothetical protein COV35_00670 [Alphaproteobacteria bacterium CG11_big_fil_rev_8_21_14_0_20_39_49]|nr:MAG: hypothetical protein COV35_00670 [Alphaproteobacteria bacterium CG11_big_fil_rev_8_21_14_0_20_39_49]
MHLKTTYTPITNEQIERHKDWVDISSIFDVEENYLLTLDIQMLGKSDLLLLDMDYQALQNHLKLKNATILQQRTHIFQNLFFDEQHMAFSKYWIFGLYEALRTFKQTLIRQAKDNKMHNAQNKGFPKGKFECLNDLFDQIEVLRMPLAKHEPAKSGEYHKVKSISSDIHLKDYGQMVSHKQTREIGWQIFNTKQDSFNVLTRRQIADRFLEIAKGIKHNIDNPS